MESIRETEFVVPTSLKSLRQSPIGGSWLHCVPSLVEECAQLWGLDLGDPFPDGHVSLTFPATTLAGQQVVLKMRFPDDESEHEALALALWQGHGAVELIEEDRKRRAMLLERCLPGRYLSEVGADTALQIICELLPKLWIAAGEPIKSLEDEAHRWITNLPDEFAATGEPFERSMLDEVIETLADLAGSQGEQVLLHQDLHANNVISAQREPWLVIDPKPLVGEREFGLSPLIRSAELGHSQADVLHRLDLLTTELGLDRERARLWAFCQAIAWGFEGSRVLPRQIEMARWLRTAG